MERKKEKLEMEQVDISDSTFRHVTAKGLDFSHAKMTGLRIRKVDLRGLSIDETDMSGMRIHNVGMEQSKITDASLCEMIIDGAQWGGAHFQWIGYGNDSAPDEEYNNQGVRFSGCDFKNGVITNCNFSNTKLEDCDITGLVINGVDIESLIKKYSGK